MRSALRRSAIAPIAATACIAMMLAWAGQARAGSVEARPDGTTVIHVGIGNWILPRPTSTDPSNRASLAVVRAFKERFAAIFARRYRDRYKADPARYGQFNWDKVEVDLFPATGIIVEGVEYDLLQIAGGVAPDVLYINFRKSDNYIQNNFLYPLDNPEDGYFSALTKEEIDFRINPKIMPVIDRKGPGGARHVWALPWGGAMGKVLLYRKDLFDEKGIAYPTVNWTWDDLLAAARKITDPARGVYGVQVNGGKHESWNWVTFLWSAGGEVMKYDPAKDQWLCTFDSPEAAVALDFYTRMCDEKWIDAEGKVRRGYAIKEPEGETKWTRGQVGLRFDYIEEKLFSQINPELTGMVPVPLGPTGKRGGELNSRMMGLFSGIKDRPVRDAAWEFMLFYDCPDAQRIKTRIMVEGGLGRFLNPTTLRQFGYPEIERLAPKGWSDIFRIAIETGKPEPYGRNCNFAYNIMTEPIAEAEALALADKLPQDRAKRLEVMRSLLHSANDRANEQMIGIIPPNVRLMRDITAVIVLAIIVVVFGLVFKYIVRKFTPPKSERGNLGTWAFRKHAWAYILLIPAVATIFVWQYIPLARGSIMAFQDYRLLGQSQWVWVQNFGDLLWNHAWWDAVGCSIYYCILVLGMTFLPPIILAVLLQEVPRGKLTYRMIFYLPAVITGLVTILLWKQFYDPSEHGVLNKLILHIPAVAFLAVGAALLAVALKFARRMFYHEMTAGGVLAIAAGLAMLAACGAMAWPILRQSSDDLWTVLTHLPGRLVAVAPEPRRWLGDPRTSLMCCVLPMVWAGMGPGCLIYLAALKGIPDDFYEAADLDGATFIDKILFVVFPILKPLILINFVGAFIGSWYGGAGNILAMTGGGANTEVADLHIFYEAFMFLRFGPATAMAWVLAVMLIGFTVYQLRILSRLEFRTTGDRK
jgi:multiple sugar transport system permease protein